MNRLLVADDSHEISSLIFHIKQKKYISQSLLSAAVIIGTLGFQDPVIQDLLLLQTTCPGSDIIKLSMLNSLEHELCNFLKYQKTNNLGSFHAQIRFLVQGRRP